MDAKDGGLIPEQTGRLTVDSKITFNFTLTWEFDWSMI
jgi:hypothetical protein